ncbi:MAG: helix-turn-helix transcriptional regulator [Alphaproteobacteria bacterium]|nr:helix-turn-helix transcriptional regulator [Alphaproteobacteria bacterium]
MNKNWTRQEAAIHAQVGRRIRQAREQAGLSPRDLAARVGITAARIARIEGGTERLTARCLFQLATITGQAVSYFFADIESSNGHDPPEPDPAAGGRMARQAETRALIAAFNAIADSDTRRDILRLLRGIADDLRSR